MKKHASLKISKFTGISKSSSCLSLFRSFTYTIHVQSKLYSLAIRRLPGEIHPERCSIKVSSNCSEMINEGGFAFFLFSINVVVVGLH